VLRDGARWRDAGPVVICLSGRGDKDVAQVAAMGDRATGAPGTER
jgi:tryptophan synthase beta subunit